MKKHIFLLLQIILLLASPLVYASETAPEIGIDRLSWALRCCGMIPVPMLVCVAAILLILVIVVYKHKKGAGSDGK